MLKINDVSVFKILVLIVLFAVLWMMIQKLVLFNNVFHITETVGAAGLP